MRAESQLKKQMPQKKKKERLRTSVGLVENDKDGKVAEDRVAQVGLERLEARMCQIHHVPGVCPFAVSLRRPCEGSEQRQRWETNQATWM